VSVRSPFAVLVVHALAPVALAAQARVTVPYTIDTLANGLTLIVHEDHSVPIVSTNVWYRVGSGDEQPGRTGFAHLFEHLMFMGSEHAPYPAFDRMLEAVGANNNGSTWYDRTNYFEEGPSNSLALMLWLEADRMGWFLPTMDSAKLDLQRDVVKNERRQSYENQPYGLADETILRMVYPAGHPYSWPTIGSMADLSAATLEDTRTFFRKYYAPNNAAIVIAGDVKTPDVRALVRRYSPTFRAVRPSCDRAWHHFGFRPIPWRCSRTGCSSLGSTTLGTRPAPTLRTTTRFACSPTSSRGPRTAG
jgi:zinc protease